MDKPVCLTTEDVNKFCERMKGCEDGIKEIRATVTEILEHVKITNGRVTKLEIWRGILTGGLIVITFLLSVIGADLFRIFAK